MANRPSPFAAELDQVIAKPKRELVDQPRDEALKLAEAPPATQKPWSTYVPFPAGTELAIKGGVNAPLIKGFTIDGSGIVKERTDDKLALSFTVDLPDNRSASAEIAVTYKEDGSSNKTDLTIKSSTPPQKLTNIPTHIISMPTERVMTPIGGLEIKTEAPPPLPEKFTLKVVHIRPKRDAVELEAEFSDFFLPNAIIQASKKPAPTKK